MKKKRTKPAGQRRATKTARRRGRGYDPLRHLRDEPEGPPPQISYRKDDDEG